MREFHRAFHELLASQLSRWKWGKVEKLPCWEPVWKVSEVSNVAHLRCVTNLLPCCRFEHFYESFLALAELVGLIFRLWAVENCLVGLVSRLKLEKYLKILDPYTPIIGELYPLCLEGITGIAALDGKAYRNPLRGPVYTWHTLDISWYQLPFMVENHGLVNYLSNQSMGSRTPALPPRLMHLAIANSMSQLTLKSFGLLVSMSLFAARAGQHWVQYLSWTMIDQSLKMGSSSWSAKTIPAMVWGIFNYPLVI